jgi:hypothetical protein
MSSTATLRSSFFFWNLPDVASPYVILLPPQRSLLGQWYMEFGLEQNLDRLYHHGAQLNCSVVPVYGMDIDSRNEVDQLHEDAIWCPL